MGCYIPDELKRAKPLSGKERLGANRNSEYMGVEDIEPGSEPILTIDHIFNALVTLQRGKEQQDVMTFREESVPGIKKVRPLIVNNLNRKTLRALYKAVTAETLEGKKVQLYLEANVRNPATGMLGDGIRIKNKKPTDKAAEPIICEECGQPIHGTGRYTAEDIAKMSMNRYQRKLCLECGRKMAEAAKAAEAPAQETPTQEATDGQTEQES